MERRREVERRQRGRRDFFNIVLGTLLVRAGGEEGERGVRWCPLEMVYVVRQRRKENSQPRVNSNSNSKGMDIFKCRRELLAHACALYGDFNKCYPVRAKV